MGQCLPADVRSLVPPLDPKALETPQEQGLRSRMWVVAALGQ